MALNSLDQQSENVLCTSYERGTNNNINKCTNKRISSKRKEYEQKREENTGLPFSKKVLF